MADNTTNNLNLNEDRAVKTEGLEHESVSFLKEIEDRLSMGKYVDDLAQAYLLYYEYARLVLVCGRVIKLIIMEPMILGVKNSNVRARVSTMTRDLHTQCRHTSGRIRGQIVRLVLDFLKKVEALKKAGIGVSRVCRFFENEAGGPSNLGFTRKDVYNHLYAESVKTNVPHLDVNCLVQYFVARSVAEPYFYWSTQMDDDGRLMNFFFRDSRCLIDYETFGDVLSIDTTYKTNRYDLIAAPFVGINHHTKNVLFGLGFLSNESSRSFEWLFETFLESMHGKEPSVVYSDQGASLIRGIDSTFKVARHRLCQWHINRNAPSHLGDLNSNHDFKKQWRYCMNGVDDEAEFEECWHSMIKQFSLGEHRWLASIYKLRKRWASVFTNDLFSAGLLATSRSESTNRAMKDVCSASSTLVSFVEQFMRVMSDWRHKESIDDFGNIGSVSLIDTANSIMSQVAKTLTRNVYLFFQKQVSAAMSVAIIHRPVHVVNGCFEYSVSSQIGGTKLRSVVVDERSFEAHCTCRLWETDGVICRHIFRIYLELNVLRLPEKLLLPRWSKHAKERHPNVCGIYSTSDGRGVLDHISFTNYVVRLTYAMTEWARDNASRRKIILSR